MRPSIYIVEDNSSVAEALVLLIEFDDEFSVCGTARTAFEALAAIPDARPDLVITDLSLPDITGIDLIGRLRKVMPGQRAVVLSGHPESDYAVQARAAGATAYILKGDPKILMERIRASFTEGPNPRHLDGTADR